MSVRKINYANLSDEELLTKIVSEDSAGQLMEKHHDLENILLTSYREELKQIRGVGDKTSERIKAIGEAIKRVLDNRKSEVEKIETPEDVYKLNEDMVHLNQEEIRIVLLNVKKRVLRVETVTVGTVSSSVVTPREIYSRAVRSLSSGIILVHNHPSGEPTPSSDDKNITQKMIDAGRALSINLLDHIIIGKGCFSSLKRDCNLEWK